MCPIEREVFLDLGPRLFRSLLDGGVQRGQLALLVQLRFDHPSIDQIGAVAARQVILRQQEGGQGPAAAIRERVEIEGEHIRFAIANARKAAKNGGSPRRVVRNTRLEPFARRHAFQDRVAREQRKNLRVMGLARAEITGNPNADFGRLVQECIGVMFEHVVEESLDHRRYDVAADLAGSLRRRPVHRP